jgi:predicted O-linked N-acetylglucosamine transferase (SPINDLY family)
MDVKKLSAERLSAAIDHHRSGRLIEAERLYRRLCDADPNDARALHLLGQVTHQLGRPGATELIGRALTLEPSFTEAHNDRGVILAAQGNFAEAAACFESALKLQPNFSDARNNLGYALQRLGRSDEAATHFERVLKDAPNSALARFNLAMAVKRQGKNQEAISHLQQAVTQRPDFFEAYINLAILFGECDQLPQALAAAERAVALKPDSVGARNNLGNLLRAIGRLDEALAQYDAVLRIDPGFSMAHYNRGMALRGQSKIGQARESFSRAYSLKPDFLEAEFAMCMAELPAIYEDATEVADRRAVYAQCLAKLCKDVEIAGAPAALAGAVGSHQPFYLPYQGFDDRELQASYGALVSTIMTSKYPAPTLPRRPMATERVRLGIVSGFFRQHSNWKIPIRGWLRQLDRKRFHITGYYTAAERDAETETAAALCDRFFQGPLSLDAWRRTILDNAPHVLLYPEIGMDKTTAQLAAQRLASVQCCSWGHPVTSGFPTMDFFLSSDLMEPPDAQTHYNEELIRLPNLSIYYEPNETRPDPIERSALGFRSSAIVYWCCQSLPKYLPQYDRVFARIAREVGDCQFTFIEFAGNRQINETFKARLDRAFSEEGLRAADFCVVLPRLDPECYVSALGQCDILLDSIGWSGCNSTLESLVHNLPIVTMTGELMRGRHSSAILDMMGIFESTAQTVDQYVSIAVTLGRNAERRTALAARIASNKHRVYRDSACIEGLEKFLVAAATKA